MKADINRDIEKSKKILDLIDSPLKDPTTDKADNSPSATEIKIGTAVIINTESGTALGYVVQGPMKIKSDDAFPDGKVQKIIRVANQNDFREVERALSKESDAFDFCLERINALGLEMKLIRVRYLFGCKKALFYFTAEGRVDFRQLVKDLVAKYKIRIELRQIGVRDETKLTGGIGSCGRELCCCSFSRKFPTVSIKMGKDQNLSLNPSKISGMCGRLLCCLSYEHGVYKELGKGLPRVGKRCLYDGKVGKVLNINILGRKALILLEEGGITTVSVNKLEPLAGNVKKPIAESPIEPEEETILSELRTEFADLDIIPFVDIKK